jgi:hypothetical protein
MLRCLANFVILLIGLAALTLGATSCAAVERVELPESRSDEASPIMYPTEQAVIIRLKLTDGAFGSSGEIAALQALEDEITSAVDEASVGEVDGNEVGNGEYVLYTYGPDADELYKVIAPILMSSPSAKGGQATIRYGDASDPSAGEMQVTWDAAPRN